MMKSACKWLGLVLALASAGAAAQTGTVPLDSGTPPTGLTNSNITEVNGNVGIGTTSPSTQLEIKSPLENDMFKVGTWSDSNNQMYWTTQAGGTLVIGAQDYYGTNAVGRSDLWGTYIYLHGNVFPSTLTINSTGSATDINHQYPSGSVSFYDSDWNGSGVNADISSIYMTPKNGLSYYAGMEFQPFSNLGGLPVFHLWSHYTGSSVAFDGARIAADDNLPTHALRADAYK